MDLGTDIRSQVRNLGVFQKIWKARVGIPAVVIVFERFQRRVPRPSQPATTWARRCYLLFFWPRRKVVGIFRRWLLSRALEFSIRPEGFRASDEGLLAQLSDASGNTKHVSYLVLASSRLAVVDSLLECCFNESGGHGKDCLVSTAG
jgi:hypothetical protein